MMRNYYFKTMVFTMMGLLFVTKAFGQNFTPQNGTITTWENQTLAVFDAQTDNKDVSRVTLGLKKKAVGKLADIMSKYGKKAKE